MWHSSLPPPRLPTPPAPQACAEFLPVFSAYVWLLASIVLHTINSLHKCVDRATRVLQQRDDGVGCIPVLAGQITLCIGTDCAACAAADVCAMLLVSLHVSTGIPIMHTCQQFACTDWREARFQQQSIPSKKQLRQGSLVPVGSQEGLAHILGWAGHTGTPPPPLHTPPDLLHSRPNKLKALGPCCTCPQFPCKPMNMEARVHEWWMPEVFTH